MNRLLCLVAAASLTASVVALMPPAANASHTVVVTGTVSPGAGLSLDAARIWMGGASGTSIWPIDTNGSFSAQVAPGSYTLWVRSAYQADNTWAFRASDVVVGADATWSLQLPDRVRVEVTAQDVVGVPVRDATVRAGSGGSTQYGDPVALSSALPVFESYYAIPDVSTDDDGRAVIHPLSDSDMELQVVQSLGAQPCTGAGTRNILPLQTPSRVSLDASQDASVLARSLPLRTVTVQLRDETGGPAPVEQVCASAEWGAASGFPDDAGRTTLVLPEGRAQLTVSGGDAGWRLPRGWWLRQPLEVTADRDIVLTLPPAVKVTTTVVDDDLGQPAAGVFVNLDTTPEDQVLADGLEPATLSNRVRGETQVDGTVRVRVFPDTDVHVRALERRAGVYRVAPPVETDATDDTDVTVRLPVSATLSVAASDSTGQPIAGQVGLRANDDYIPFASAERGTYTMKVARSPSPVWAEIRLPVLGGPGALSTINRAVVVEQDTSLTYRLPEMHDVDVLVLGRSGRPADVGKDVAVKAPTIVESDAGAVSVIAKLGAATDSQGWAHVVVPKSAKADLSTADAQGVADDVPIDRDRAIVLQAGVSTTSVGVPYSLLGPQGRPVVDRTTARVSWGPVDADSVEFQQRVVSVKGFDTGWTRFRGIVEMESRQLAVEYVRGATTCLRAISSLDGVVGPASTPLCRTRPVDDGKLDRVGEWKRPESSQASLGRYSFTKERGARLVLEEVKVSSEAKTGQVTLMVLPTVDGGSIRLRSDGRWISRTHSLAAAGRLGTQPAVGPVPVTVDLLDERAAIRGQVVVVVQTQGLPIRIDGLALPVPLG